MSKYVLVSFGGESEHQLDRIEHLVQELRHALMADVDILNAAIAGVQATENQEDQELQQLTSVGASIQAAITYLESQVSAGAPNLAPAIAAIQALQTQNNARLAALTGDVTAGTAYAGTLPTAPADPASAVNAPVSASAAAKQPAVAAKP